MRSRSRGVSVGFSPVVPHGTRKWTPASICRRPRRRTAASSRSPLFVNGVTNAVPTPVHCVLIFYSLAGPHPRSLAVAYAPDLAAAARPLSQRFRPACPAYPCPSRLQSEHVSHCEPASLACDPLRRDERAARERAAIARHVRQGDRFG